MKKYFVFVPKVELYAAFISNNHAIMEDDRIFVVCDDLTQKTAKERAARIRKGQEIVEIKSR